MPKYHCISKCCVITILLIVIGFWAGESVLAPHSGHAASAVLMQGDLTADGEVNLTDAIVGLQVISGVPSACSISADTNDDDKIGIQDIIYILQSVSRIRSMAANAALMGPLSGASVKVITIPDMDTIIYETTTNIDGNFHLYPLNTPDSDSLVLVEVSGGTETDADGDGVLDATGTSNTGSIYALIPKADFNTQNFRISVLTDIVY